MYSRELVVEGGSVVELEWRGLERERGDTHIASPAGNGGSCMCVVCIGERVHGLGVGIRWQCWVCESLCMHGMRMWGYGRLRYYMQCVTYRQDQKSYKL